MSRKFRYSHLPVLPCNLSCTPPAVQEFSGASPKRRRAEEKDEGIGSPDALEEEKVEELRREMLELRQQLDKERAARMQMEEQVRSRGGRAQLRLARRQQPQRVLTHVAGGWCRGHILDIPERQVDTKSSQQLVWKNKPENWFARLRASLDATPTPFVSPSACRRRRSDCLFIYLPSVMGFKFNWLVSACRMDSKPDM